MNRETTQPSLLSRVRNPADHEAWREFDHRYRELLLRYCRARGLQATDAEDVRQIVMANLARSLPGFRYDRERGRFRGYLGRVVRSAISEHFARPNPGAIALDSAVIATHDAGTDDEADALWEEEWLQFHYRTAMNKIRSTFEPRSIEMFDRLLNGATVAVVSEEFNISPQAVHKVKMRIRDRLKELIAIQVREEESPDG
jgi:RNA polymerase sigma-70 factor (ECF subfamily)